MPDYQYLGNFSTMDFVSLPMHCDHCNVGWGGCAAESFCPKCGAAKGYRDEDFNECYCPECKPDDPYWRTPPVPPIDVE